MQFQPRNWQLRISKEMQYSAETRQGKKRTKTDEVDDKNSVLQRHECEVGCLHPWPEHEIGLVGSTKSGSQPFQWVISFEDRHGG